MKTNPLPITDLWTLVKGTPSIDPNDLLAAINSEGTNSSRDFRTKVLLRDSFFALTKRQGEAWVRAKLSLAATAIINELLVQDLGDRGFSTLGSRLMNHTRPDAIEQFLRELGLSIPEACRLSIGGSCGLNLQGLLYRCAELIDVDQIPAVIQSNPDRMKRLSLRYGLQLAIFETRYLPDGWQARLKFIEGFGQIQVYVVDPLDTFVGKMFSRREKDLDDLRMLNPNFTLEAITDRFKSSGTSLLSDSQFRSNAERNWYILFGQSLPA